MRRRIGFGPFGDIRELQERMEDIFRDIEEEALSENQRQKMFLDIVESDGEIVVTADLPGVRKEDIDLRCTDDSLTVTAERATEEEEEEEGYVRRERSWGSYRRSIELPTKVDCDGVSAKFRNGVLEVKLPEKEEMKGRKVSIE